MPFNPPQAYRKVEFIHRAGLAAARPAAADVLVGTLYFSTDTLAIERSNGAAWVLFGSGSPGPTGPAGMQGVPGLDGQDGADGLDGLTVVGPTGPAGIAGTNGRDGLIGPPGIDAEESEYPYIIPGPAGSAGSSSAAAFDLTPQLLLMGG